MKVCKKAFEHMYLIDAESGQVWPCAWLYTTGDQWCLGNILTQSVDEIFNSDIAVKFRESILDGSYRYCSVNECAYLSNDTLPDLSEAEISSLKENRSPKTFVLAYEETCNHCCISCRHDYFKGDISYYDKVDLIGEKLLPYLNEATSIGVNGRGEIFVSEHMLRTLDKVKPHSENFKFNLETNAAFFDEKHFKRIEHLAKKQFYVTATVNSFHDSTYRYLNGYANHVDKVIDNLKYMKSLREQNIINKLSISMVVQESNFRELPEYVDRCLNEFGADAVRVRGIMKFSMDEDDFWMKDVFNPAHPFYKEALDILHHPIMRDERVWFWEGDYEHTRKPVKNPARRFQENYENLWRLMNAADSGILKSNLQRIKGKKVVLFGAGHISEYLIKKINEYEVDCEIIILDSYHGGELAGMPILSMRNVDFKMPDTDVVVNTISYYSEDVKDSLDNAGYNGVVMNLYELMDK